METKKCNTCKKDKELTGFFKDPAGAPMNKCKACLINGAEGESCHKDEHAEALALYNSGLKYHECAEKMGTNINTLKTWISRARKNALGTRIR